MLRGQGEAPLDPTHLRALLHDVARGHTSVDEAAARLGPASWLSEATLDLERPLRTGLPEVIYGEGKTIDQIVQIVRAFRSAGQAALVTRIAPEAVEAVQAALAPEEGVHHPVARLLLFPTGEEAPPRGHVAVVSAGTTDMPVAEECALTAEAFGRRVLRVRDVGVAGLHRLLARLPEIREANVIVVVAGMDGALPSVVAGLVDRPVVACPTSVGYGAAFGGLAPLLTMLNACAPGVSVVNIDNGFGAACVAVAIDRLAAG